MMARKHVTHVDTSLPFTLHPFDRFADPLYALLRIGAGVLFACHGAQKLFGALGGRQVNDLTSQMGLAGLIELVGGLLIALGLVASWAGLIAGAEMVAAYFIAHAPEGGAPINNGGELALLYALVFFYVAARGAGAWSLESALRSPRLHRTAEARR
jgi:putative oxidoreductase